MNDVDLGIEKIIFSAQDGKVAEEYGSSKTVTCVKMIRPATTYNQASSLCAASGGYLAYVKTVDKPAMVVSLSQGNDFWIGLDDQVTEGVYV
ncbi:Zinc finger protein [Plakobranchus ocellatus]|uniref:Zinc finger protein n=1 Tax=Plakobranchus ocellatus TaxID=259542 RepID=A0AAV4DQ65_9GAST|nr:Zinc finger protein [Plakobranchus ocellatus]